MPRRPRSHQLEDLSLNRFRDAVPSAWVVRERSRDYGVDLEVEIFTESGEATGLFFYVQLKATDDPNLRQKLRFDVDQLQYFRLLDLPVAIVRYAAPDDTIHLMWAFEVPQAYAGNVSQTLRFTPNQRWTSDTPNRIIQTLENLRQLNRRSDSAALAVELLDESANLDRSYAVQAAFECLRALGFVQPNPSTRPLTMEVRSIGTKVVICIDRIAEVSVDEEGAGPADLTAALAWSAVRLLWNLGLKPAAHRLARRIVAAGHPARTPSLALAGALSLLPDTAAAIDLACEAGIHRGRDESFLILIAAIHNLGLPEMDVDSRITFFRRALEDSDGHEGATAKASLNYSMANAYRGAGRFAEAVAHYNRALKLRAEYADVAYFWAELASCLYMCRKFRAAARAYEEAFRLDPTPRLAFLSADAQLGAGEVGRAAELYDIASQTACVGSPGEANLKAELCRRLAQTYGLQFDRQTRRLGPVWDRAAADGDWVAVLSVDPLDGLGNFNHGKALSAANAPEEAFWRFLTVALMQTGDDEAWCNTLICAFAIDVVKMATVLYLGLFHRGRAPYDLFRGQLAEQGACDAMPQMDAIVRDILAQTKDPDQTLVLRLFDGQTFRHVLDIPSA